MYSRVRARPSVASQRLGALGGFHITRRPQPGSGGSCGAWVIANVTFETMNVAARMVDGFNMGGSAGGVDIVCIYDEDPSSTVDSFVTGVTGVKTAVRLLLLEPDRQSIERGRRCSRQRPCLTARSAFMPGPRERLNVRHRAGLIGGCDSAGWRRARQ